ncbi:MAG: NADPH-dependent oxidoreductase [Alphaproteobacteria bacterium]|nr:NADPH-dependent oxidoreductase [Alphaproteobacteria bacterium]
MQIAPMPITEPVLMNDRLHALLEERFGAPLSAPLTDDLPDAWHMIAGRGSCRHFTDEPVSGSLIETLCALAFCSPSKSDLQQRDIILIEDERLRTVLNQLLTTGPLAQEWISKAPHILVFCGNNRRQRQIHQIRGKPFVNDHLDALFNPAVDAGIALAGFMQAAEAVGLGCCPISAIRNEAQQVSNLLGLPDHVFPVAGLALGWPKFPPRITMRLPLTATLHKDQFNEENISHDIEAYDQQRNAHRPIGAQRDVETHGEVEAYGWSEDKARQYTKPEREHFGAFIKSKGFTLD